MKGTGLVLLETKEEVITSSFCKIQTYSFHLTAHLKLSPSCGFHELQVHVYSRKITGGITTTPSGGEEVASLAFLSYMGSPASSLRGQSQAMSGRLCYMKGKGVYLVRRKSRLPSYSKIMENLL